MQINYIEQLRAIINATGWSQVKLANELGVTFATLNRWLNSHAKPHPAMQKAIYSLFKEQVGILPLSPAEIKNVLSVLAREKKKHPNIHRLLKENERLQEDFLLELTYNSNAIEGSTLTKKETESIIFDQAQIADKSYSEHLAATNHAAALKMIFAGEFAGKVTEKTVKELHRIIMQGIRPDAGQYSKHHRAIRGVALTLPGPEDIQEEMALWLKRVNQPKEKPIIEHIAKMHAAFEAIHPFGDGNGRVGRLLMTIQLLNADYSPAIIEKSRKAEYYEVLEYAQRKSETHLVKFVAECVQKGYQIIRKHKK
jgi:Fic family protein